MSRIDVWLTDAPALEAVVTETPEGLYADVRTTGSPGVVEVLIPGPAGRPGPRGEKGEPGAGGGVYVHEQGEPSATWLIPHGQGRVMDWVVTDSAGNEYEGDVSHPTLDLTVIEYDVSFGGTATGR